MSKAQGVKRYGDGVHDPPMGRQRGVRILEYRLCEARDLCSAIVLNRPAGEIYVAPGGREKTQNDSRQSRLAASRFADKCD
jgi:hypothetical protein